MTRTSILLFFSLFSPVLFAQNLSRELAAAIRTFESDPQMRHAIASLYVLDGKTGAVVFDRNGSVGLAPASTLKVVTSASAYMLLGKDFRYKTHFGISSDSSSGARTPYIFIQPGGDPTLGSWRWPETGERAVIGRIVRAASKLGLAGDVPVRVRDAAWPGERVPDGWIWQDIGNYYGAGASGLNWRENRYDLLLRSGEITGSPVSIAGTVPASLSFPIISHVKAAAKGTGDNAYIYYPLGSSSAVVRGTIPVGERNFTISGAFPDGSKEFLNALTRALGTGKTSTVAEAVGAEKIFHTETSPSLDSIIYWFNRQSINLYGEAMVKTIAVQGKQRGTTEDGLELIRKTWTAHGIQSSELNLVDGSGLSPMNRITTHAQAVVLFHAQKQPWFPGFYESLPMYNGMKMKSGTIRDTKGFCGYHRTKAGKEFVFAFLVNNYNGSSSALVSKMYRVLDVLK